MMWLPNNTIEETIRFLTKVTNEWDKENPSFYEFAIVLDAQHVGAMSVSLNGDRTEDELGWILNKQYWGKGYTVEAAIAIRDFSI